MELGADRVARSRPSAAQIGECQDRTQEADLELARDVAAARRPTAGQYAHDRGRHCQKNLHAAGRLAHRYGARILVDGAQLVPHRPLDRRGTGQDGALDFLVFSAHKLYAPYGGGALITPSDVFVQADLGD